MADNRQLEDWRRQALLTEYEVCEQDNAANFQGFWTLAAIFIGLSSAFLAGLIYAVIANKSLFGILLNPTELGKNLVIGFGIIALVIGIANIVILKKIKGWHRRIMFNQRINSERMREIELTLGMQREWRKLAVEKWCEVMGEKQKTEKSPNCNEQIWCKLEPKLTTGLTVAEKKQLQQLKSEICCLIQRIDFSGVHCPKKRKNQDKIEYEPPSSKKHFPCIFRTFMLLWGLVIVAVIIAIVMSAIKIVSSR